MSGKCHNCKFYFVDDEDIMDHRAGCGHPKINKWFLPLDEIKDCEYWACNVSGRVSEVVGKKGFGRRRKK